MARRVLGPGWYFSKQEIEENSPSRHDGMHKNMETILRRTYSAFQLRLGSRLGLTHEAIATAIVFCHRFFLRQSLARNDRKLIGTACMFIASRVFQDFRELDDVVMASYEIIHEFETTILNADQRRMMLERERNSVLRAEELVLRTINRDFNVGLPYVAIDVAVAKFNEENRDAIKQCALNFVNDALRTTLFLQFRANQIAAAVIYLSVTYFLALNMPHNWLQWSEFGEVTMIQITEIGNQIFELRAQAPPPPPPHSNI